MIIINPNNPDNKNIKISKKELDLIRSLKDFDLTMFLSELSDFGWNDARKLLPMIKESMDREGGQ